VGQSKMDVISVSRRTDIPAFYSQWFINRIRKGWISFVHPFSQKEQFVSLSPRDVIALVFWSKNYGPLLSFLAELEDRGYYFYFHFTITGLPRALEPGAPSTEEAISQFRTIASRLSSLHIQWRFDPLVITEETDLSFEIRAFERIAAALEGYTYRCYISFVHLYQRVIRNFRKMSITFRDPEDNEKIELACRMAEVGKNYGIALYACCNDLLVNGQVHKAHCIDPEILLQITPHSIAHLKISPTRPQCGCLKSIDIGKYDSCPHGCLYCYANADKSIALKNYYKFLGSGSSFSEGRNL